MKGTVGEALTLPTLVPGAASLVSDALVLDFSVFLLSLYVEWAAHSA